MRRTLAALGVMLFLGLTRATLAFEVEEEKLFPAFGPEIARLSILSTTDTGVFHPVIAAFQALNPGLAVRYTVANSREVHIALHDEGLAYDLAISSAMDLQMQLANDGLAAAHQSDVALGLPAWARWQDRLFAFAQEPVVMIASRRGLEGLAMPRTRRDLIELLRDNPARFTGRIGTYDPETSGAGYLFATQDARQSDTFWRLAEVMGGLHPRLYSSTSDMISDLKSGELILAYNVLGSYATPQFPEGGDGVVIEPEDHTLTLLRTALIPKTAEHPELGGAFLDFLLGPEGRRLIGDEAGLPPIDEAALASHPHLRPIRLEPGLLVYLDALQRKRFLGEWRSALIQP